MDPVAAAEEARLQREWFPDSIPGLFRVSKAEAAADLDVIQASLMRLEQQPQPPLAEAPVDRTSKKSRLIDKIFREATPHHLQREEHANLRAALDQLRAETLTLKDAMANMRRDHALALRERIAHEHHFHLSREDMLSTVAATEAVRQQFSDVLLELRQRLDLAHDDADVARVRLEDARAFAARLQAGELEREQLNARLAGVLTENAAIQEVLRALVEALYKADNAPAPAPAPAATDASSSSSSSAGDATDAAAPAAPAAPTQQSPVDALLCVLSPAQLAVLREIAAARRADADADAVSADAAAAGARARSPGEDVIAQLPAPAPAAEGALAGPQQQPSAAAAAAGAETDASAAPSASDTAAAPADGAASAPASSSRLTELLGPAPARSKRAREDDSSSSSSAAGTGGDGADESGEAASRRRRFAYQFGLPASGTEGLPASAAESLSAEARGERKTALEAHACIVDFDGVFDPQAFFVLLRKQVDHIMELQAALAGEAVKCAEALDEAAVASRKVELLTAEAEKINSMVARLRDSALQQELAITAQESRTQAVLHELDLVRREKAQLEAQKVADDIKYQSLVDCLAAADVRSVEAENGLLDALQELRVLRAGNSTLQAAYNRLSDEREALARSVVALEDQVAATSGAAGAAEAAAEATGADAAQLALRLQKQMAATRALSSELKASEDSQRLQQKEVKKLQKQLADIMGTRIGEQIDVLDVLEPKAKTAAANAAAAAAGAGTTTVGSGSGSSGRRKDDENDDGIANGGDDDASSMAGGVSTGAGGSAEDSTVQIKME